MRECQMKLIYNKNNLKRVKKKNRFDGVVPFCSERRTTLRKLLQFYIKVPWHHLRLQVPLSPIRSFLLSR